MGTALEELANDSGRTLRYIETTARDTEALNSLTHSDTLTYTLEQAAERLDHHQATIHATRIALLNTGVLIPRPLYTEGDAGLTLHIAMSLISQQQSKQQHLAA